MPEDNVVKTAAEINISYEPAKKSTQDFEKILAKLNADIAKLQADALRGFNISGLGEQSSFVTQMREALKAGRELTEEEAKRIAETQRYVYIQRQNVEAQKAIVKAVEAEAKEKRALATIENELAAKRAAAIEKEARAAQERFQKQQAIEAQRILAEQQEAERMLLRIPALQAELATMQKAVITKGLESTELAKQINLERQKADLLEQQRASGSDLTASMRAQTLELEKNVKVLKAQLKTAEAGILPGGKGGGKGETFWERRFGWFVAGSTFFGTLNAVKSIVRNIAEIESAMVTIQRISNETTANFKEMQQALLRLGVQYGQTWNNVSDIAIKWAQAGYNVADTLKLTEVALLGMNTAELNSTEITQGMIAIMSQWQLQAEELLPVLDKINKVADSYAISSGDLIQGLSRSSGAAKLLGLTLEDTISLLTVMRETTGRTGKEVGNALNSILAFMQRPAAIQALESVGIEVWADKAHSKMNDIMGILGELSSRWDSMSTTAQDSLVKAAEAAGLYTEEVAELADAERAFTLAQQQGISQQMAGTYRRNYFLALLQNWAKTTDVLVDMETALGYSLRENEKTMDTYEKKVYQLKAAWQEFTTMFAEAGILDGLKFFVDAGRVTLETFSRLPTPIKAATAGILAFAAAVSIANLAVKTFTKNAEGIAYKNVGEFLASGSMGGVTGKILSTIFSNTLLTGGVVAGVVALQSIYKEYRAMDRELRILTDTYNRAQMAVSKYEEELDKLNRGIEDNTYSAQGHKKAQDDLQTVMNTIGDRFPHLIRKWDELGNIIELDTTKMKGFIDATAGLDETERKVAKLKDRLTEIDEILSRRYTPSIYGEMPGDIPEKEGGIPLSFLHPVDEHALFAERMRIVRELGELENILGEGAGDGTGAKGIAFDLDNWRDRLDKVSNAYSSLELELIQAQKQVRLMALEEERLRDAMADGDKVKEASAQSAKALAWENSVLYRTNEALAQKLEQVKALQSEAAEAMNIGATEEDIRNATNAYNQAATQIARLTSEIASNTVKIRENEIAIEKSGRTVEEYYKNLSDEAKKAYEEIYRISIQTFEHQARMLNTSIEQQIQYYRRLMDIYRDDYEKRWDLERTLQQLYRDALEERIEDVERAYEEQLDALQESMDREIRMRQEQIEAIDALEKGADRAEAARQHAEKIKELEEKIAYERLRTGIEHERNIVEYTKQIEEENIRWQNQQAKWARDDRKEQLQNEIDDIRASYQQRQRELEDAWRRAEDFLTGQFTAILSTAAVYDSSWFQKGLDWASQFALGFRQGIDAAGIDQILSQVTSGVGGASQPSIISNTRLLLEAKREWEAAFARNDAEAMRRAAERGQAIRAAGPTLDPNNDYSADELEALLKKATFDTGGKALTSGLARLAKNEIVLRADLSTKLERYFESLPSNPSKTITVGTLVKFENVTIEDRADADYIITTVDRHLKELVVGGVAR